MATLALTSSSGDTPTSTDSPCGRSTTRVTIWAPGGGTAISDVNFAPAEPATADSVAPSGIVNGRGDWLAITVPSASRNTMNTSPGPAVVENTESTATPASSRSAA